MGYRESQQGSEGDDVERRYSGMITGTCHCGAIRIEVPELPRSLLDCNCSICRRYGALWALYEPETVRIVGHPKHMAEYVWGAKTIATIRCRSCGCVTHWTHLQSGSSSKIGMNMRNFNPRDLGTIRTRRFDGAESWAYLDED